MQNKKALILVDLQNDFCKGGSLYVPEGDEVISIANQIQDYFDYVIVTKDWHPKNHMSFASNHAGKKVGEFVKLHGIDQILWPDHCVQHTKGSELHPELKLIKIDHIVHKGTQPAIDSYSAFFDNEHLRSTELAEYLKDKNLHDIYIMGLATDYCVKYSCLDALQLGFKVSVILEGCRGVNLQKDDVKLALQEMQDKGAAMISFQQILKGAL